MSDKIKDGINGYSVDYRKENINEVRSYNTSKSVVAGVPSLRKINIEDIKIKEPTKSKGKKVHTGVCMDAVLPSKATFYRILFGCVILLLSIIGCVIFVSLSSNVEESLETSTFPNENFSNFLSSIVMHDPEPFSSCESADKQMLVSSALWRTITQNGIQKYNNFDEKGCALVPFDDVYKSCQELFGEECKLNKQETHYGPFYTFSSNDEHFHVSAISNQNSFLPYIENSWEEKDCLILKVAYILRSDNYFKTGPEKSNEPTPIKHMKYILKKHSNNSYYVFSVENI